MGQGDEYPAAQEATVLEQQVTDQGLIIEPNAVVAVDITPKFDAPTRSFGIGNGVKATGQAVAEIRFGGATTYASGLVVDQGQPDAKLLVIDSPHPDEPHTITLSLRAGELWGVGRKFEGQDKLPDTVSGDHCAVGLDEQGRLVIENHQPTNATFVRTFGS